MAAKYASDRKDGPKLQALSNAATNCASFPLVDLQKSLNQVAVPVHGVYVAKPAKPNSPRYAEFENTPNTILMLTEKSILIG